MIRLENLSEEPVRFDGGASVIDRNGRPLYTIGDKMDIQVAACDISTGRISFVPPDRWEGRGRADRAGYAASLQPGNFFLRCLTCHIPPILSIRIFWKGGKKMGNALKKALVKTEEQPHELLTAIRDTCRRMDNAKLRFEMESDSDLIEACIYEMESLRARYRYLLRMAGCRGHGARETQVEEKGG